MATLLLGIVAACTASALFNLTVVIAASEARAVSTDLGLHLSLIGRLLRRPRSLAAAGMAIVAWVLQTTALLYAPLTIVQPADAAGLILLLVFGSRMLGDPVGLREKLAVGGIIVSVCALALVAPHRSTHHAGPVALIVALGLLSAVAVAPYLVRDRLGGRSLLIVAAAGSAYAATAFLSKLIADALSGGVWAEFALVTGVAIALGILGSLSELSALQLRPASQVAPIIFVAELVAPVLLGMLLAGETPTDKPFKLFVLIVALIAVAASVYALGRSRAVAGIVAAGASKDADVKV